MMQGPFALATQDGFQCGPWRTPVNIAHQATGTIHADATAQTLGLRGGAIAGSIHMEQFAPLALALFGDDWFTRGALSLYFQNPTLDGEPVRCRAQNLEHGDDPARAQIDMIDAQGAIVCAGTASFGRADPHSALRQRLARLPAPSRPLRMLAGVRAGDEVADIAVTMPGARLDSHLPTMTEPLAIYREAPKRALPANLSVDVMSAPAPSLVRVRGPYVGLYGAIELRFIHGPLREDTHYLVSGRVLALGETPRTEIIWYESLLREKNGVEIAHMIMMTRLMKAASPLWRES